MIKTDNIGIRQAVKEVRSMSLSKRLRLMYEAHLKEKRDRWAIEAFIKEEGRLKGKQEGIQEGIEVAKEVQRLKSQGRSDTEIAHHLEISMEMVRKITD